MRCTLLTLLLMVSLPAYGQSPSESLQDAFKKEFAFLEAEQVALNARLAELNAKTRSEAQLQNAQLAGLQRQIVAKTTEADAMAESLVEIEREVESLGESEDALANLVQQISRSLDSEGVTWAPKLAAVEGEAADARLAREADAISTGFSMALSTIAKLSTVRREAGHFFLADGRKIDGTLVRVGRIAVYGVSGTHAGALTPAGNGMFKLDPAQGAETARALVEGRPVENIGVFLFESTDKNYEPKREKTVREIIDSGGIIAWVIVSLGILALLLIAIRTVLLLLVRANPEELWECVEPVLAEDRMDEVTQLCRQTPGAGARILAAICPALKLDRQEIEAVFAEQMILEESRIDRFGPIVLIIAAVAPLLGLLGTVTGMISTFDVITEFGTGNPKLLSGGISEALVTTELGLCVAIPALLLGNILNGWAARMKSTLEFAGLRLVNRVRSLKDIDATSEEGASTEASEEMVEEQLAPVAELSEAAN